MSLLPEDYKYTQDHEWVMPIGNGKTARIGLTDFAQKQLGDVVYVELPETGRALDAGEPLGSVESVKAVSEIYAPIDGTVATVNTRLDSEPELLNEDPYGDAWVVELTLTDPGSLAGLLTAEQYRTYIEATNE